MRARGILPEGGTTRGVRRAARHKVSAQPWPASAEYSRSWVVAHRGHVGDGAASAFSAWQDSLWGPWRVWCQCGDSLVTSRASCELICLVARPSVLRMDVEKWLAKAGDQTAACG